jgi:hypothetical protein
MNTPFVTSRAMINAVSGIRCVDMVCGYGVYHP